MKLTFNLDSWSAWSESKTEYSEWESWANGSEFEPRLNPPDLSSLPAMKRRRLSKLSKIAYSTANNCFARASEKPICIFATQHGELHRTIKIINNMVSGQDVSPTDFSLSVHSTALGLFSLFTNNTKPSTTVVAGEDTFGLALVEAHNYLARFPSESVLVVYYDEPIPSELCSHDVKEFEAFSVALLLTVGEGINIEFTSKRSNCDECDEESLGVSFLKFYLSGEQYRESMTRKMIWRWERES